MRDLVITASGEGNKCRGFDTSALLLSLCEQEGAVRSRAGVTEDGVPCRPIIRTEFSLSKMGRAA